MTGSAPTGAGSAKLSISPLGSSKAGLRRRCALRNDGSAARSLQRRLAVFAVGEASFLRIEIAFDPPPYLVGNLAVAQQAVNEFPLRRYQFPRQLRSRHRDIMRVGIEEIGRAHV